MRVVKTIPGTPIDRSHPLAWGLVGAWSLAEGWGVSSANGAGPANGGSIVGAGSSWVTAARGPGLLLPSPCTTNYADFGPVPALNGATRASVFVMGSLPSGGSSQITVARKGTGGAAFGPGTGGTSIYYETDTGSTTIYPNVPIPSYGDLTLAHVFDGTQATAAARVAGYWNGLKVVDASGFSAPTALPTTPDPWRLSFGNGSGQGGARYDVVYLWVGRALTAGEVLALHNDPLQLYAGRCGSSGRRPGRSASVRPGWWPRARAAVASLVRPVGAASSPPAAVPYRLSGSPLVVAGKSSILTVQPLGDATGDVVTASSSGGASVAPGSATMAGASPLRLLFSASSPGSYRVTVSSAGGGEVIGSPLSIEVEAGASRRRPAWVPVRATYWRRGGG